MALRVFERNGTFYIRGTVRGQSVYETCGTDNAKAAEEIRAKREAALLEESIHGRAATVTFAQAASSYLDSRGSARFLGRLDAATGKWDGLIGHFGSRKLNTITQSDLDRAANTIYPDAQWDTRNRQCHTPFVAVWNHAEGNRWCDKRTWRRPRKPKGTNVKLLKKQRRAGSFPVSYEHASKFVQAMSPAPAMLMTAFFYTGMRPIELFTLEAEQVDVKGRWIALPASKTGEPRGVPMHEVLVPLFTGLMKRGGFLFRTPRDVAYEPRDDDNPSGGQMKTAINGARRRSGICDIAPYTGRHSVSTQLVVNGVHPHIKDQILGHAADDMSRHYTHVPQQPLIEAINTLPVIDAWAKAPWMKDPLKWAHRLVEGTGKRNDILAAGR
jgi:integrase/recombinase XerD